MDTAFPVLPKAAGPLAGSQSISSGSPCLLLSTRFCLFVFGREYEDNLLKSDFAQSSAFPILIGKLPVLELFGIEIQFAHTRAVRAWISRNKEPVLANFFMSIICTIASHVH